MTSPLWLSILLAGLLVLQNDGWRESEGLRAESELASALGKRGNYAEPTE